jgi:DNA-binding MarR family transcriptional regulator
MKREDVLVPTTDPLATLNPSIIGRAEKVHSAFLKPLLAGSMLDERQWITLQLAVGAGDRIQESDLVSRVAGAARYDQHTVEAAIAALRKASLIEVRAGEGDRLAVTPKGLALVTTLRRKTAELVGPAYASISAEDLATAARVLNAITAKLSEGLANS